MSGPKTTTISDFKSQEERRYGAYNNYNSTDINWIDRMPENWETTRLRNIFDVENGSTPKSSEDEYWDGDIAWATPDDLEKETQDIISETKRQLTEDGLDACGATLVPRGSVLLSTRAPIGHLAVADVPITTNQGCKSLVFKESDYQEMYFYYFLKASKQELKSLGAGSTYNELNTRHLKSIKLAIPPQEEQKAIVEFLGEKTKKIDSLIDRKEKLLELLEEKRTAIITNAVTQGLDSDIETKASGIPGVGEIPENWELSPLKYSTRNISVGIVQKPSQYYVDEGVPALRSLNVNENKINKNNLVYISEDDNKELKSTQLYAGDLVSVRSGDPGTTAVVPEELDGVNCIDLIIIRKPDGYIPEFLSFLMNSEASTSQIEAGTEGAAQQHFNVEEVKELVFPKPGLQEQREILEWLSPPLKEIDELEEKVREGIEYLTEYRTALITEAVTGQIDIRGEV